MKNKEKLIAKINNYCDENQTDTVQGSNNFFLSSITEHLNKALLKELCDEGKILFDDFQNKATQLPLCRNYFHNKSKRRWLSVWRFMRWIIVWVLGILSGLIIAYLTYLFDLT